MRLFKSVPGTGRNMNINGVPRGSPRGPGGTRRGPQNKQLLVWDKNGQRFSKFRMIIIQIRWKYGRGPTVSVMVSGKWHHVETGGCGGGVDEPPRFRVETLQLSGDLFKYLKSSILLFCSRVRARFSVEPARELSELFRFLTAVKKPRWPN